jgi:SAM-dependent methyltransferase
MVKKITRGHLEDFLQKYKTEERTLDIGSGGSSYGRFFPNRLMVDVDPARKPEIVADAHKLPFSDGEFSSVLCTEVLEHVKDPFQVERELRRVTAPGGMLILTTRFVFPIHDAPGDYWRFTPYALRMIFSEWEIVELRAETRTLETLAVLLQRIGFQTKFRFNKLSKAFLFAVAWVLQHSDGFIKKEFGDIGQTRRETGIMSSGYYIVCRKK